MDLSIIVPVYNVEEYIRPCIDSIFHQGLDDDRFEIIIVNDGTQDHSIEVIQDIIEQHKNIIVINQENQGLSVARNNGISIAKGDYIIMPDSDDILIEKSLKPLLEKAIESQADLVDADYITMTNDEIENIESIQQMELHFIKLSGDKLITELDPYECHVWHTLYKRMFLINKNINFCPAIRYEDIPFTHECYLKADNCLRTSYLSYIYRKRHGATTSSFKEVNVRDFSIALAKTWELANNVQLSIDANTKLRENIWVLFTIIIRNICFYFNKEKDRIRMIDIVREETQNIYFHRPLKKRIIYQLFKNMPHSFIRLSYILRNFQAKIKISTK